MKVTCRPAKPGILDPQGEVIARASRASGYPSAVRAGKVFDLELRRRRPRGGSPSRDPSGRAGAREHLMESFEVVFHDASPDRRDLVPWLV